MKAEILHGDCRELLRSMPDNSIDSLVTDPPYEYEFMNQRWDGTGIAFEVAMWKEVFRVLKPGAYGAVFGADRRIHRVMCALEDAGFLLRHQGAWVSAQVFPKSLDAGKAIDARLGKERADGAVPVTPEAEKWDGYGTALKTMEPWVLIRKPLDGTLAENLIKWGVGALNIGGARLPLTTPGESLNGGAYSPGGRPSGLPGDTRTQAGQGMYADGCGRLPGQFVQPEGRWPSVLICSDLDLEGPVLGVEVFGAQDDDLDGVLGPYTKHFRIGEHVLTAVDDAIFNGLIPSLVVCPKVGPAERDLGCDDLAEQWVDPSRQEGSDGRNSPRAGAGRQSKRKNIHPTVKPISLMRHLIRLVTPAGGTVLDNFTGSAAGGMAAVWEGMSFVGCELTDTDEQPFVRIGRARLAYALRTPPPPIEARVVKPPPPPPPSKQLGLFDG